MPFPYTYLDRMDSEKKVYKTKICKSCNKKLPIYLFIGSDNVCSECKKNKIKDSIC